MFARCGLSYVYVIVYCVSNRFLVRANEHHMDTPYVEHCICSFRWRCCRDVNRNEIEHTRSFSRLFIFISWLSNKINASSYTDEVKLPNVKCVRSQATDPFSFASIARQTSTKSYFLPSDSFIYLFRYFFLNTFPFVCLFSTHIFYPAYNKRFK